MSTSAIGSFTSSYLQQVLAAIQSVASGANTTGANTTSATQNAASAASLSDSTQLSPFAQLASALQQLEKTNPIQYQQVTAQIAASLQTAAQTAASQGNSSAESQLTQLSTDFTSASQTGALPNLQDLAQAVGGSGGGHRHHHEAPEASSESTAASSGNASTDPQAIIAQALVNAGVKVPGS